MVDIPEGDLLRNSSGRPVVRIWAYMSPRAQFGFVIPRGCARTVPNTATSVEIMFFDAKTRQPVGMEPWRTPKKPSLGTRSIRPDELGQFSVTC